MGGNAYALEKALQQYFYDMLANQIKGEVEKQFDDWGGPGGFLDKFADLQKEAVDNQIATLKADEEEKRRSFERALFLLQVIAPVALSWVAASLQYRVGPKIFSAYTKEVDAGGRLLANAFNPKWTLETGQTNKYIASKVFGDIGKQITGMIGSELETKIKPPEFKEVDAQKVAASKDAYSFKTNLLAKVKEQKDQAVSAIMQIAQNILTDVTFGHALRKRLHRVKPHTRSISTLAQEQAGHEMINKLLNQMRAKWADDWYYYRCSPPRLNEFRTVRLFEKELWALWILQQRLQYRNGLTLGGFIIGASGNLGDAIVEHIWELGLPVQSLKQGLKHDVWDPLGVNRSTGQSQEQVDTLNSWAESHPPKLLSGTFDGTPRTLVSVEQIWTR